MNDLGRDLTLMGQVLQYLIESIGDHFEVPPGSEGHELFRILDVGRLHYDIRCRTHAAGALFPRSELWKCPGRLEDTALALDWLIGPPHPSPSPSSSYDLSLLP